MRSLPFLLLATGLFTCSGDPAYGTTTAETATAADSSSTAPATGPPRPVLVWETDTVLTTCESVLYDAERDRLYVANIEGKPWELDGAGSISLVSLDGRVTRRDWVRGLNAPKGMGLSGGRLYVADVDALAEIDVAAARLVQRHAVPGAGALNDVTVTPDGTVYVSDSETGRIHRLGGGGTFTTVAEGIDRPNGLLALSNDELLSGNTGGGAELATLTVADGKRVPRVAGVGPDGIVALGEGRYLLSRWRGQVDYVAADWTATTILDTTADELQSADIEYVPGQRLLLVPTFFGNKVMAYRLD